MGTASTRSANSSVGSNRSDGVSSEWGLTVDRIADRSSVAVEATAGTGTGAGAGAGAGSRGGHRVGASSSSSSHAVGIYHMQGGQMGRGGQAIVDSVYSVGDAAAGSVGDSDYFLQEIPHESSSGSGSNSNLQASRR